MAIMVIGENDLETSVKAVDLMRTSEGLVSKKLKTPQQIMREDSFNGDNNDDGDELVRRWMPAEDMVFCTVCGEEL